MQFVSSVLIAAALINSGLAIKLAVSKVDDITVSNANGRLHCDKIECPQHTVRCHVSKRNTEGHPFKVTREITCYGPHNKVLQQKSWNEVYTGGRKVNVQVDMNEDGHMSIFNEGNSIVFNKDFVEQIFSAMQQIGTYFSGFRNFFPFSGIV